LNLLLFLMQTDSAIPPMSSAMNASGPWARPKAVAAANLKAGMTSGGAAPSGKLAKLQPFPTIWA